MKTVIGGLELAYTDASSQHFKKLAESGKLGLDVQND